MSPRATLGIPTALVTLLALGAALSSAEAGDTVSDGSPRQPRRAAPAVPFVPNVGETDGGVEYSARMFHGTVFVTRHGQVVYAFPATGRSGTADSVAWAVTETFVDGRSVPVAGSPAPTRVDSFIGDDPSRWRRDVPTYADVLLGEVWAGITVRLKADGRRVEKVFTVAPGAPVDRIRVRVDGIAGLVTVPDGTVAIRTQAGEARLTQPVAYQVAGAGKRPVEVAYAVSGNEYGFRIGSYDPTLPLVIDPVLQATYVGGSGWDQAAAIAVNQKTGDVYVAGQTKSVDFPCTRQPCIGPAGTTCGAQCVNAGQQALNGSAEDAYVAKLDRSLTVLAQITYLGGTGGDWAADVAVDQNTGDVYVAGVAQVDAPGFPVTPDGAQTTPNGSASGGGSTDAFVAQFSGDLTTLKHATFLGGGRGDLGNDGALALAVDSQVGNAKVYVAGYAISTDFGGVAASSAQSTYGAGGSDAFVARLDAGLSKIERATYLGGSGLDDASAIAVSAAGVYVAGRTASTDLAPAAGGSTTNGGAQTSNRGGAYDAFVARLDADLTMLDVTYLGGQGADEASALALEPGGDVYVAGASGSPDLPCSGGPGASTCSSTVAHCAASCTTGAQSALGGGKNAFVARLSADLKGLKQTTYFGATGGDAAVAVAVAAAGVYVAGGGSSILPCTSAPCTGTGTQCGAQCGDGVQLRAGGSQDAFLALLDTSLTTVVQATHLGGVGDDGITGLAVREATSEVYVTGGTTSADFAGTSSGPGTSGGAQSAFAGGGSDAFVARLSCDLATSAVSCSTPGLTSCGCACVDLQGDSRHCGACGAACGEGQRCCGGRCVDVRTDRDNCGACGHACGCGLLSFCCGGKCTRLVPPCVSKTCGPGECGTKSDGCGGVLDCGVCPSGSACSSKGRPYPQCVCVPKTCARWQCGSMADGCGGTVECKCPDGPLGVGLSWLCSDAARRQGTRPYETCCIWDDCESACRSHFDPKRCRCLCRQTNCRRCGKSCSRNPCLPETLLLDHEREGAGGFGRGPQ